MSRSADTAAPVTVATALPGSGFVEVALSADDREPGTWRTVPADDPSWSYSPGHWTTVPRTPGTPDGSAAGLRRTRSVQAWTELTFEGRTVELVGELDSVQPRASWTEVAVVVDGVRRATVSNAGDLVGTTYTDQVLASVTDLGPGAHTLRLEVVGPAGEFRFAALRVESHDGRPGSGVVRTEYRVDVGHEAPWQRYDGPFRVTGPGYHSVTFRSVDGAGNVEEIRGLAVEVRADQTPPSGANPFGIGNPFQEKHASMWQFVRAADGYDGFDYPATTFRTIADEVRAGGYERRGIHHLVVYGPYASSEHWLGLPALDFFAPQVGAGTVEDFREMVDAAHEAGMTVSAYIQLIYVHPDNPVFVTAARDRARGVESFESNLFRWDERPDALTSPRCPDDDGLPPETTWTRHPDIADNRCYVQAWGEFGSAMPRGFPALDYERPEAMAYAKDVLAFWMDLGLQGFMWDAPHTYLGMQGGGEWRQRELQIDFTRNFVHRDGRTKPTWHIAEGWIGGFRSMAFSDRVGFTSVFVDDDNDANTFVLDAARAADPGSVRDLLRHWEALVDTRRLNGRDVLGGTRSDPDIPPALRALDAAVHTAGVGVAMYTNVAQTVDVRLGRDAVEALDEVLRVVARTPALAPGASRHVLPTPDDVPAFAVLRHDMSGEHAAIAVFNLSDRPVCVPVDLGASGVRVPQVARDIATGDDVRIDSTLLSVPLETWGFRFIDVDAAGAPESRAVAADDPGWTLGGGAVLVADPSAFRGVRHAADADGAWSEIVVEGRSVQGWARTVGLGTDAVRVLVDGIDRGSFSLVGHVPFWGEGAPAYGQRVFVVDGLEPGRHTVRLEYERGAFGADVGGPGIEYLLVSDRDQGEPAPPESGECR